jgi:hypothetical protein
MRINNFCNNKFTVFIVELFKKSIYFNIFKIKLDLVFNAKVNRGLIILIREFFLLLLCCDYCGLCSVLCFAQLAKNIFFYLNKRFTCWPELFRLERERFHVVFII